MKNFLLPKKNFRPVALILTLLLGVVSCQKELTETFKNPNQSTQAANIRSYAASAVYATFVGSRFMKWNGGNLIYANTWSHQYTHGGVAVWFGGLNTYGPSNNSGWGGTVAFRGIGNTIGQCRVLWEQGVTTNDVASTAIAQTLFLYNISIWSKVFGSVPFDDVYTYDVTKVPIQPKYEDQLDVFIKILTELGSISQTLSGLDGVAAVGDGDFVYRGDVKKWEKFVNTLRLRLALEAREALLKRSYAVDDVIRECVSRPLISELADEAIMPLGVYSGLSPDNNLDGGIEDVYYGFAKANVEFAPMAELVDYLQDATDTAKSDPRLDIWCTPPTSTHRTIRNASGNLVVELDAAGAIRSYPAQNAAGQALQQGVAFAVSYAPLLVPGTNVSALTTAVLGTSLTEAPPTRIMTLAESKLLQAEAAVRGITSGNVKGLYDEALAADMRSWKVDEAKIAPYVASGKNSKAAPTLQNVLSELWVAYFTNNWQSWTLLRRTKYEDLAQVIGIRGPRDYVTNANLVMPSRFVYPDVEKRLNPNAEAAGVELGGDSFYSYIGIDIRKVDPSQVGKF